MSREDELVNGRVGAWGDVVKPAVVQSAEEAGVPTSRAAAVDAGGLAAASVCTAYGAGLVAPLCASAGRALMDSVILPIAEAVYNRGAELVFGSKETAAQVAYKNAVAAKHNEMALALSLKLNPLFLPAYKQELGQIVHWYLIGSFAALQAKFGVNGPDRDKVWPFYEAALVQFVAPGGRRDQGLAARVSALLAKQKREAGFSPKIDTGIPLTVSTLEGFKMPQYFAILYASLQPLAGGMQPQMIGPFATPQAATAAATQLAGLVSQLGGYAFAQPAALNPGNVWQYIAQGVPGMPQQRRNNWGGWGSP